MLGTQLHTQGCLHKFELTFKEHLLKIILNESEFFGVSVDADVILNTGWGVDGLTWQQRLLAHRSKWESVIGNDLKISFLKKENIADVLTQVTKRCESMEKILTRLVRTESSATSSMLRQTVYKELGVKKYRFIHIDGCTCEKCNDMHNRVFLISEYVVGATANPLHPNCDDTTMPVVD